jgi:MFS family permease
MNNILHIIYSAGFLFTVHTAFLAYINSSFLSGFIGENYVGLVFTGGAVLSLFFLSKISGILSRFGNFKTAICFLVLEIISLLGLAFLNLAWLIVPLFIFRYAFLIILKFNFDVFIEHFSTDKYTGGIRGAFLTIVNLGWVISPIIVGAILTDSDFWKIYLISALLLVPVLAIIYFNLKSVSDGKYDHPPFWITLKEVWQNKNIYKIFMAGFLLQFFFGWMVIYTPIYLNQHISLHWDKIGIIFTIMLLPYVLFELPLGRLADRFFGEKEFLSIGFIITGLSTALIAFISSSNMFVWAAILFTTRIGASFIEIMSESYFFKQIDATDVNIISFFRNTRPLAYIIAPLVATAFLQIFAYQYLFVLLGVIMLFGLRYSLTLRDTK